MTKRQYYIKEFLTRRDTDPNDPEVLRGKLYYYGENELPDPDNVKAGMQGNKRPAKKARNVRSNHARGEK